MLNPDLAPGAQGLELTIFVGIKGCALGFSPNQGIGGKALH